MIVVYEMVYSMLRKPWVPPPFGKRRKRPDFLKWGLGYKPEGRSWVGLQ